MAYNGSVELISGIKQANNGTFPLVDASAVRVSDDKRLDAVVGEVAGKAERTNTVLETTLSRGRKSGTTVGVASFAFGTNVEASGDMSHAEGNYTTASGLESHAEGDSTTASGRSQHVFGEHNVPENVQDRTQRGTYVEIVGNGASTNSKSNARALDWNGNEHLMGDLYIRSENDSTGGKKVAAENMIAAAEAGSTAAKNYPAGSLLIVGSKLYKATAAISAGDTIIEGTNVAETTLADELSAIWAALQQS